MRAGVGFALYRVRCALSFARMGTRTECPCEGERGGGRVRMGKGYVLYRVQCTLAFARMGTRTEFPCDSLRETRSH